MTLQRDFIEDNMEGAVICGDEHFSKGRKLFDKVEYVVPFRQPPASSLSRLTTQQAASNASIRRLRQRVENTFAFIERKFVALQKPWMEDETQLDCLVWFAAGVYNSSHF